MIRKGAQTAVLLSATLLANMAQPGDILCIPQHVQMESSPHGCCRADGHSSADHEAMNDAAGERCCLCVDILGQHVTAQVAKTPTFFQALQGAAPNSGHDAAPLNGIAVAQPLPPPDLPALACIILQI